MKKLLVMLSIVGALMAGFSSCDNKDGDKDGTENIVPGQKYCWKFTVKVTVLGQSASESTTQCNLTEVEAEAVRKEMLEIAQVAGVSVTVTKQVVKN